LYTKVTMSIKVKTTIIYRCHNEIKTTHGILKFLKFTLITISAQY